MGATERFATEWDTAPNSVYDVWTSVNGSEDGRVTFREVGVEAGLEGVNFEYGLGAHRLTLCDTVGHATPGPAGAGRRCTARVKAPHPAGCRHQRARLHPDLREDRRQPRDGGRPAARRPRPEQ